MTIQKPIVAMIYDFDGTLAPGNMQEYDFLKEIGVTDKAEFWRENDALGKAQNATEVLSYMKLMIDKSNNPNHPRPITRQSFKQYGASIPLFKGVKEWFALTRKLGEEMGLQIEHASHFMYDADGRAMWPAAAIDFTAKMQILYMINKGVENISDNKEINNYMAAENRRIPFNHMIYFGDGLTDIPSMKLLRSQGGFAIAIYTPEHESQTLDLVERNIINFACKADYSKDEALYNTVKAILEHIKSLDNFNALEITNIAEAKDGTLTGSHSEPEKEEQATKQPKLLRRIRFNFLAK